jgi:hypothetical protein
MKLRVKMRLILGPRSGVGCKRMLARIFPLSGRCCITLHWRYSVRNVRVGCEGGERGQTSAATTQIV